MATKEFVDRFEKLVGTPPQSEYAAVTFDRGDHSAPLIVELSRSFDPTCDERACGPQVLLLETIREGNLATEKDLDTKSKAVFLYRIGSFLLGSGWAAIKFLQTIDTTNQYDVTVVSPRNYFLFTPFLPSCVVGTVEPRSIVEPIRHI